MRMASWQEEGHPQRQPHEYTRGGTAKLLTLFHPATGQVRAAGVTSGTTAVLHTWLRGELAAILAGLPPAPTLPALAAPDEGGGHAVPAGHGRLQPGMISALLRGCAPASARSFRMCCTDSAMFSQEPGSGV